MRIDNITLKNFRVFREVSFELHPAFNLIIGINGTGKTAILEGLRVAVGSLFLDMDKVADRISTPNIKPEDVRLEHLERQYPVEVTVTGNVLYANVNYSRDLVKEHGRTRYKDNNPAIPSILLGVSVGHKHKVYSGIKEKSREIQQLIRRGDNTIKIPLIAYYSTERYKREKYYPGLEPEGSRLRGYYNAMDLTTNLKFFTNLFRTEAFKEVQRNTPSAMITVVKNAVKECIFNCEEIKHDIGSDRLLVTIGDRQLPFDMLSDGIRSMLSMVMEIAFRCFLLNPWLGERAALETPGIILIDEIDLHIHPAWQRRIISDLQRAFPAMQFVASTHSPVVVSSMKNGNIYALKDGMVYPFPPQFGRDANSVLLEMGGSERQEEVEQRLKRYFILIERGEGKEHEGLLLRSELESLLGQGNADPDLQRADAMLSFFED